MLIFPEWLASGTGESCPVLFWSLENCLLTSVSSLQIFTSQNTSKIISQLIPFSPKCPATFSSALSRIRWSIICNEPKLDLTEHEIYASVRIQQLRLLYHMHILTLRKIPVLGRNIRITFCKKYNHYFWLINLSSSVFIFNFILRLTGMTFRSLD